MATAKPKTGRRYGGKADCAEFFGVSLPTVDAWVRSGMPVEQVGGRGVSWVIDILAAAEWKFTSQSAENDPNEMSPTDRDKWFRSERNRRDLQILDRELIPRSEVERDVSTAWAAVASDLRSIPDKLERRIGISPLVAEQIEIELNEIAMSMYEKMSEFAPESDLLE